MIQRVKPAAIGVVVGGASGYIVGKAEGSIDFLRNNWYASPLAMFGVAVALGKKSPTAAHSLAGAAGMLAYIKYGLAGGNPLPPTNTKGYDPDQLTDGVTLSNDGMDAGAFEEVVEVQD